MKRRLIALSIIVVMLAALVATCISCSTGIFSVDEDRDYHQVIATVTYGELSKDIYKGQLATYVNSYGATYQQNYNMTIEEIVEYFYNNLTRSALLALYAKYYVYEKAAAGDADFVYIDTSKAISQLTDADFITLQERVYAIDITNDDFISSYEKILDGLTDEDDEEDEDEDDEDLLDPRTVRDLSSDDTSTYDKDLKCTAVAAVYGREYENLTYGEITEDFIKNTLKEESIETFISKIDVFGVINAKIKAETDITVKKNMKSALNTLKDNIAKSYTGYDWFLTDTINSCITQDFQDSLKKAQTSSDDEIAKRYTALIIENLTNLDEDTYASAISGSTFLPVNVKHTYAGTDYSYTGVKSILLKFSDEQSALLTALKTIYAANEDLVDKLKMELALGISDPILDQYITDNKGITVNISDPFYDSSVDKLATAYTDKDVNYLVVLYCMANSIQSTVDTVVEKYKESDEYAALSAEDKVISEAIVTYSAKVEAFTQWIYLVNDDSGMFSSESYAVTPQGTDTSYVKEYTILARKLAEQDIGDYVSNTYASGSVEDFNVNYTDGSAQYIVNDKTLKLYTEDASTNTTTDTFNTKVFTAVTEEGNAVSFIINDYGIHIIMNVEHYGEANFVSDSVDKINDAGEVVTADEAGYAYNLNAIYDKDTTIRYNFVYTAVATDATFDANEKYYIWEGDGYARKVLTADTFDPAKTTYYTRVYTLDYVKCEYQTLKSYLDDEIITSLFSTKYSSSQIALYLDLAQDGKHAAITKVDKVYDKLIEDYSD